MTHGGSRRRRRKRAEMNLQTGGPLDAITDTAGGVYDTVAGVGDYLAGDVDEAIGRTFDDKPGGGVIHGFQQFAPFLDQPQSVTERQVEEGILGEESLERTDVSASSASLTRTQNEAPPGGRAVQKVRVRNGLAYVSKDNPNRRLPDSQDIFNPKGALLGIGGAAAGAAAMGASAGSVAGPAGAVVGGAAGAAGSLVASEVEERVGALGYTVTSIINGNAVGQTVASVGVPPGGIGKNGRTITVKHQVPKQPGTYDLSIVVSMWKTGEEVATFDTEITVEEGAPSADDDNTNGDSEKNIDLIGFAKDNPGIAVLAAGGGLVAVNAFAGGAAEGIAEG